MTCYFQVVPSEEGTLLHLSTFGSSDRESPPKSSQSLQLDRMGAEKLIEVIRGTFPAQQ